MKPIPFKGSNVIMGENQEGVKPLPALHIAQDGVIISCWELSEEELEDIHRTGRIYLQQWTGNRPMQPVMLATGLDGLVTMS